jgi:hypothetical protein
LKADAERYRWLRKKGSDWFSVIEDGEYEEELDSNIDAAIKGEPK